MYWTIKRHEYTLFYTSPMLKLHWPNMHCLADISTAVGAVLIPAIVLALVQLFSSSVFSAADAALDQLLNRCKQLLKNGSRISTVKEPLLQLLIFFCGT
jgi:hypothetical protein